ncbi:sulfate/molybdate ABC transporter ATP-binding protein [Lacisediminihabitans changchengi]|uniref:ABC transporter ATP-binding protein n=1 Tax=Lacisediminihabitans changchengi TaxID=2787634 RepID=A0A934W2M8_9MICO|nr:ABC transporter ATP-binding protein [Lacisediminihabitans changchengi]MBK4346354.1 ABC transporter ATP-binding protein [Lacisediminihabitans changchengi]
MTGLTFQATVATRRFDLSIEVPEGTTVAVLGPNGAGKSTLLSLIAGLLKADSGSSSFDDTVFFGPGVWLPPHRRGVALLAQEALLFPHLTVLENVAFGPRSAGELRAASRETARRWLDEVEASDLAQKKPGELSGGQAQRVAIARALAAEPALLLLDEPLAALDIAVTPTLRRMLRRVLRGRTAIIVTHEVLDALTLADHVIVLGRGGVVEQGPTREVLERPRHPFTAELAGLNLLLGRSVAAGIDTAVGVVTATSDLPVGRAAAAAVRPSAIEVLAAEPSVRPGQNLVPIEVSDLEPRGDVIRVRSEALFADLTPAQAAALDLVPGSAAWFSFAAHDVSLYAV